jgi:hypothetical protein
LTAVFFLNRGRFNLGEQNLPVFSEAADVQEGFSATGTRCAGHRGFMLSIFLLQH